RAWPPQLHPGHSRRCRGPGDGRHRLPHGPRANRCAGFAECTMIPLYISRCFGVLHPGHGTRGAVICGPLTDEALNCYRPLVFLAEQLAAAEIPTLRLAYYGTGDSAGDDDEPARFDQWLHSIAAAVAWLRE